MSVNIYAFADEAAGELDAQIAALAENGLDGLEIRGVDGMNVSDISADKAKEIKSRLDAAGLRVWSIGSPIGKINIERDDFGAHLEKFRHTLDIADILGAECFRLFSFYIPEGKSPEDYRNEVTDRLGKFADIASGHSAVLCHENEKGIYGDNAGRCLDILTALPDIKGIFDPANFIQCGQDTMSAWETLRPYIKYMHIKDALSDGSVVPAGKGEGRIPEITADFISRGGKDFTVEPHLAVFSGLSSLERESGASKIGKYVYGSTREAFDAACAEFKKIIGE